MCCQVAIWQLMVARALFFGISGWHGNKLMRFADLSMMKLVLGHHNVLN